MNNSFLKSAKFYDLLYKNKPYESECYYVESIFKRMDLKVKNLLDLGCGTGRHSLWFCERGIAVTGIDLSQKMLAQCKAHDNFTPIHCDITQYKLEQKFDMVVALFHVASYLEDLSDLDRFFWNASRHVKKGGGVMLDVWNKAGVEKTGPEVRTLNVEVDGGLLRRIATPTWRQCDSKIDINYKYEYLSSSAELIEQFSETHTMRYYSNGEIMSAANRSGFRLEFREEFLTGANADETWTASYTFRKI